MKYAASVSDFFQAPKWGTNLLMGAVAFIIPVVGPIVLSGWHITGFWARRPHGAAADFPAFDFAFFGKYLERGLWPFVVNLVASLVLVPLAMAMVIPLVVLSGIAGSGHESAPGPAFFLVFVGMIVIQLGLALLYQFIATPLMLRATLAQDFKAAFDLAFVRDFLSRVWMEMLVTMLFLAGLGLCLMIITVVTCYIGLFFAAPVLMFSWHHLQKQLYQLYLARGGAPVLPSPKLNDLPPPLPGA
jgi:hypothetical protein